MAHIKAHKVLIFRNSVCRSVASLYAQQLHCTGAAQLMLSNSETTDSISAMLGIHHIHRCAGKKSILMLGNPYVIHVFPAIIMIN